MVKKEFPCDNGTCNHTIVAISPDDEHTELLRDRCCDKSIEKQYECDNCKHINTRFWCVKHPSHVAGPIIASGGIDIEEGLSSKYTDPF